MGLTNRLRCSALNAGACFLIACGYDIHVNPPTSQAADSAQRGTDSAHTAGDTTHGGTFQRANLIVTVTVTGADSTIAARVGAPNGVLAGAVVTIQRAGSGGSLQSDTADAAGRVKFGQLVPGA